MDKITLFQKPIKADTMCECTKFGDISEEEYECLYEHIFKQCRKKLSDYWFTDKHYIDIVALVTFEYIIEYNKLYDYSKFCWPTVFRYAFKNAMQHLSTQKYWYSNTLKQIDDEFPSSCWIETDANYDFIHTIIIDMLWKELWQERVDIVNEHIDSWKSIYAITKERWITPTEYSKFMRKRKLLPFNI